MWDARERVLWWVDIPKHELHRFDPATGAARAIAFDVPVTAVAPRRAGGLVAAVRDGFAIIEGGALRTVAEVVAGPPSRMNDGRVDPEGRFWAGTTESSPHARDGTLYRLDPDGSVHAVLTGVALSNGVDWSPDGTTMYHVDSLAFRVDAYRFDAGVPVDRRALVAFPRSTDPLVAPDGMCVDAEGYLWVAVWGGSAVRRFSPDGEQVGEIRLPVSLVTSCAFGGEDLGDLYVTTASEERSDEPHAGGLFRCRPGVRGQAPHAFTG